MALSFLKSKIGTRAKSDDPLAQFEAESAFSMHGGSVAGSPATAEAGPGLDTSLAAFVAAEPLALETVLGRRTPVSWLEAVAIIEATCGALIQDDGGELPVPDPSDILLTSEGSIEVRTGFGFGRGDSVQRLARTLHGLTSGQALPAPLRLFISKWIAADGNHTIAEFARELAYFARPNGAELIREVYIRCATAAAVAKKQALKLSAPHVETEAPKTPTTPKPRAARRSRAAVVIAALSFVVAIVAGIAVARSQPPGQGASSDILASLLARAAEFGRSIGEVRTQIGNLSAQLSAHLASSEEPAAATPSPPPAAARGASNRGRGVRPSAAASARSSSTPRLPDISDAAAALLNAVPPPPPDAAPEQPVEAAPPAPAPAAPVAIAAPDPEAVYSNADPDVSPPKMVYPQLPPAPLVLGVTNNINVMEIVIGDNGSVEKVKLVSPPRRMTDMMLLSGAKSWKFAPASKDGLPVRYRIAVSWATTP